MRQTRSPLAKANLVLKKLGDALARLVHTHIAAAHGLGLAKGTMVQACQSDSCVWARIR